MTNQEVLARHQAALVGNYGKLPVAPAKGEGSFIWDVEGKRYIDLFAGFGGTILGHCHPALVRAITEQAEKLWAVGNYPYVTEPAIKLAEHLKKKAFEGRAFFCHSGAEANEAAIKVARLWARNGAAEGRYKIISMTHGFHGRTLGALSATPTADYQRGVTPLVPGFVSVPFNNLPALEAAIDADTAAVLVEPIQGEGGINMPADGYLAGVRKICDAKNVCLIFDEVWTGVGRTGKYFGYQHWGVTPDVLTLGKALGGGIPVGAMFAKPEIAAFLKPGTHGCTLGGNPVCTAVAAAVWDVIDKENLTAKVTELGAFARQRLEAFARQGNGMKIKQVRGKGLMIGIELEAADGTGLVKAALDKGLMINVTHKNVIRLAPALTISKELLSEGLDILEDILGSNPGASAAKPETVAAGR